MNLLQVRRHRQIDEHDRHLTEGHADPVQRPASVGDLAGALAVPADGAVAEQVDGDPLLAAALRHLSQKAAGFAFDIKQFLNERIEEILEGTGAALVVRLRGTDLTNLTSTDKAMLFNDPLFPKSLRVTAVYSALAVPLGLVLALGLALLAVRLLGDPAAAAAAFEDVLSRQRAVFGGEHPDTLATRHQLAITMAERADMERATGAGDAETVGGFGVRSADVDFADNLLVYLSLTVIWSTELGASVDVTGDGEA